MTIQVEKDSRAPDCGLVANDELHFAEATKSRLAFARSPGGGRLNKEQREFLTREMQVMRRHTNFLPTRNLAMKKQTSNRRPFHAPSPIGAGSQLELGITRQSPVSNRNPLLLPALSPGNMRLRDFAVRAAERSEKKFNSRSNSG